MCTYFIIVFSKGRILGGHICIPNLSNTITQGFHPIYYVNEVLVTMVTERPINNIQSLSMYSRLSDHTSISFATLHSISYHFNQYCLNFSPVRPMDCRICSNVSKHDWVACFQCMYYVLT